MKWLSSGFGRTYLYVPPLSGVMSFMNIGNKFLLPNLKPFQEQSRSLGQFDIDLGREVEYSNRGMFVF